MGWRTGARGSLMVPLQERRPRTARAPNLRRGRGVSPVPGDSIDKGVPGRGGSRGERPWRGKAGRTKKIGPGTGRGGRLQWSRACADPKQRGFSLSRLSAVSGKLASGLPACCRHFAVGFRLRYLQQHVGLIGIVVRRSHRVTYYRQRTGLRIRQRLLRGQVLRKFNGALDES